MADHTMRRSSSANTAQAVKPSAGIASSHATALNTGLRLTTHTASGTTTIATAPNNNRPSDVSSISGYSNRLSSCADSRKADGWRLGSQRQEVDRRIACIGRSYRPSVDVAYGPLGLNPGGNTRHPPRGNSPTYTP